MSASSRRSWHRPGFSQQRQRRTHGRCKGGEQPNIQCRASATVIHPSVSRESTRGRPWQSCVRGRSCGRAQGRSCGAAYFTHANDSQPMSRITKNRIPCRITRKSVCTGSERLAILHCTAEFSSHVRVWRNGAWVARVWACGTPSLAFSRKDLFFEAWRQRGGLACRGNGARPAAGLPRLAHPRVSAPACSHTLALAPPHPLKLSSPDSRSRPLPCNA